MRRHTSGEGISDQARAIAEGFRHFGYSGSVCKDIVVGSVPDGVSLEDWNKLIITELSRVDGKLGHIGEPTRRDELLDRRRELYRRRRENKAARKAAVDKGKVSVSGRDPTYLEMKEELNSIPKLAIPVFLP